MWTIPKELQDLKDQIEKEEMAKEDLERSTEAVRSAESAESTPVTHEKDDSPSVTDSPATIQAKVRILVDSGFWSCRPQ